jgi:hypothetical protein
MDTSLTRIGSEIDQEDLEGNRYAIKFGAKVLHKHQRRYTQIKRELWGIIIAIKVDCEYLK